MRSADQESSRIGARWVLAICLLVAGAAAVIGTVLASERGTTGPDIVVFDLFDTEMWGSVGGITAYSIGTESCNRGDVPAEWVSGTSEHPVIAQNLYRLKEGRLEQIGMSWLKHGFYAINGNACAICEPPPGGGSQLGVGCSDPYWATLNGAQGRLGPRSEVNGFTGVFPYPHGSPSGDSTLRGRLQVASADVEPANNPSALYFVEGQYVSADDAAAGNALNNCSYRTVTVGADLELTLEGSTWEALSAIHAWAEIDPDVIITTVQVPGGGVFNVAFKASANRDDTWRYEYAIHNLNSHRSAGSFTVPFLPDTTLTNVGFHDVDYHSGEPYDGNDWTVTVDRAGGTLTWATEDFATDENANALRWGTMYNFWFDADGPPLPGTAAIGLFRPGMPAALQLMVLAPSGSSLIFWDGFESGSFDAWAG